jgi:hypothetical protein
MLTSPFPGMDPYIESPIHWGDFHAGMIIAMREELNARLPLDYIAESDLYVWIHEPDAKTRLRKPDVYVAEHAEKMRPTATKAVVRAPQQLILPAVPMEGNKYLRIIDAEDHQVITVIEILSPDNKKSGPDRDGYLAKRNEYLASGVNLVEIDLLRRGKRMPLGDSPPERSDYYVLVERGHEMPRVDFWPFSVRDALPDIPVPLGEDVEECLLPLRPCMDRVYNGGRYAMKLKYEHSPKPPLSKADAAWARELLKSRTLNL